MNSKSSRNRKRFSVTAYALSLLIALSVLGGCGSSDTPNATVATESTADDVSSVETANESTNVMSPDNPYTFDTFFNFTFWPVSTWEATIPLAITERTGITLNPTIAGDSQQLALMIASNDLPDLVMTDSFRSELSTSELCYDWGGLIEQYNIDWDIPQMNIANALSFTQEEGKFFSLMNNFSTTEEYRTLTKYNIGAPFTGSLVYRHDLYEKMGSPKLENMEDLKNMLIMAHEQYPDKVTMYFDNYSNLFSYFRENFGFGHQDVKYVENSEGNWVTYVKHENYLEYMHYLNDLYRAGVVIADNYATEPQQIMAALDSDGAFSWSVVTQDVAVFRTSALKKTVPDGIFYEAPILGDPKGFYEAKIGNDATFITKNCTNPELAIQFLKFMHSEEGARLSQWGREGVEYTFDSDGVPTFSQEWIDAMDKGEMEKIYGTYFAFGASQLNGAISRCSAYDETQYPNYKVLRENYSNYPWISYAAPVAGSDERIIYDQLFGNPGFFREYEAKLLMSNSDAEFDSNYEEMLKTGDSIGMNSLEEFMDERIKAAKKVYGVE